MKTVATGLRVAGLAALVAWGSGCIVVATGVRAGAPLPPERVEAIRAGSPVRDALDGLGPPSAVARRGTTVRVPGFSGRKVGSREVAADPLFARFAARQPIGASDVIFLFEAFEYERSRTGHHQFCLVPQHGRCGFVFDHGTLRRRTERLYLLVDGARRVVRDSILEVEGGDPPPEPAGERGGS